MGRYPGGGGGCPGGGGGILGGGGGGEGYPSILDHTTITVGLLSQHFIDLNIHEIRNPDICL